MSSFWPLLRDGLRLSLLRTPREIPLNVSPWPALLAEFIGYLILLPTEWLQAEAPRIFVVGGLSSFLIGFASITLAAWVLVAMTQRKDVWMTVAAWLAVAGLLPAALAGLLVAWSLPAEVDASWAEALVFAGAVGLLLLWIVAIFLRLAIFLAGNHDGRTFGAVALALAVAVLPACVGEPDTISTDWDAYWAEYESEEARDDGEVDESAWLAEPETTFYLQPALLQRELDGIEPQRPGVVDMFVVGFGGDGEESVFLNEVAFLRDLATHRLDAGNRQISLINNAATAAFWPLATATNLERALVGVAQRMDVDEDILFLYLTSHGSPEHELYVNQPPLALDQLTPGRLRDALDASGIRWRVIVVSACYSGGFVNALRDPRTLVITAARHDRTSFGCGNASTITWFGLAFLVEGLNESLNFRSAFLSASRKIAGQEKAEALEASEPQWVAGDLIGDKLKAWRAALPESQPIAFEPAWVTPQDAGAAQAAETAGEEMSE